MYVTRRVVEVAGAKINPIAPLGFEIKAGRFQANGQVSALKRVSLLNFEYLLSERRYGKILEFC